MIKRAALKDIAGLLGVAQEFIAESDWGWEYSEEHSIQTFANYINAPDCIVLYVEGYKGFALCAIDNDFCKQTLGYISKFYISPSARGTRAGRKLIEACNAWFDYQKADKSFVTDTANIKQGRAFKNLMAKYGYRECGDTLCRGNE